MPLSVHHIPVCVTFAFFETPEGDVVVLDPTVLEEQVMDGYMSVAMNAHRCVLSFPGCRKYIDICVLGVGLLVVLVCACACMFACVCARLVRVCVRVRVSATVTWRICDICMCVYIHTYIYIYVCVV